MSSPSPPSLLSSTLASASSLVLLQLFSRLFVFGLTQALVRLVSPQVFGTASIQFGLLLSTILFLSREGVRNALLRAPTTSDTSKSQNGKKTDAQSSKEAEANEQLVANIALIPVLLGIPITIASTWLYIANSSEATSSQPHFHLSVIVYALAAFFELLAEPLYIRAQNELRLDVRVRAEGIAVVLKNLVSVLVLVATPSEWSLVAFAAGQLAYGVATFLSFWKVYRQSAVFWLRKVRVTVHDNTKTQYFDTPLLNLSAAMTGQSAIKHFLTEGDKLLVSRLSPLEDQGGYAIASNYGSLAARIVFQPIEETSRLFFSKLLSASSVNTPEALRTASSILLTLLLLFSHLLFLLITFAPPYLPLAISILLPPRYLSTSAPAILQVYVYYIPMMAFNGVLEAFFASTATPDDLRNQSRWLLMFSACFIGGAMFFTNTIGLGDTGLVWANIVNLALRAGYAWVFVLKFFGDRNKAGELVSWKTIVPPFAVLRVFIMSAILTRWSFNHFIDRPLTLRGQAGHIGIGVSCVAVCLAACFVYERSTFQKVFSLLRKR